MIRTNLRHREEEQHNNHETPGRQTKQSNRLSLRVWMGGWGGGGGGSDIHYPLKI